MRKPFIKIPAYFFMIFFPAVATFGRTGIVVRSLQEMDELNNPTWWVALDGVSIAIAYWSMFSGHTIGYIGDQLVKRDLLSSPVEIDSSSHEVANCKAQIQSNRCTNLFGNVGYFSGVMLGLSEGGINFLGTRHLFILMKSKNDYINFIFPLIFGISATVCWISMVAPKARDIFRRQSTVLFHDDDKLTPTQRILRNLFGGFTGLTAGIGLSATVTYGILGLTGELPIPLKLAIAAPFMFFSAISASLFYMGSNAKLVSELFQKYEARFKINCNISNDFSMSDMIKKLIRASLCTLVIGGGAYATFTLSYVSIQVTLLAFVNLFSNEDKVTELPNYFFIFQFVSSLSLAFTATAVSGREGCRFITSKGGSSDFSPSERDPLVARPAISTRGFWFRIFYQDKIDVRTKARRIREEAERSEPFGFIKASVGPTSSF